jgi:predicted porin
MRHLTLAILTIAAASVEVAHAQSSVTLYGLIATGIQYANNSAGGKQYQLSSGGPQADRVGFRGVEDLGGGLSTVFVLENGFSGTTGALGQGGDFFGRQAYVGVSSSKYGTLTLGRQYDESFWYIANYSGAVAFGAAFSVHPGDMDNLISNHLNNSIAFKSVNYGGFSFGGIYSLGGIPGQFSRNQIYSVGGRYDGGALSLGVSYVNARNPNYSYWGNNPLSSTTGSNMSSLVYAGYASAKTQQNFAAGASYKIGSLTLAALYTNVQFNKIGTEPGLPAVGAPGSAKFNNVDVSASYFVAPDLQVGVGYTLTKGYDVNHATYQQANAGVDYFLSKRTDLYLIGGYQHASGTDSTGKAARAQMYLLSPSSTANQVVTLIGIRHKF